MTESHQDFALSYPCFLVGSEPGSFSTADVDGEQCLCLFTDEHLANRHSQHVGHAVTLTPFLNQAELLDALEQLEPQLRADGILFVAFDSAPGKRTIFAPIADFISDLRAGRI